jgi:hypothetical protein
LSVEFPFEVLTAVPAAVPEAVLAAPANVIPAAASRLTMSGSNSSASVALPMTYDFASDGSAEYQDGEAEAKAAVRLCNPASLVAVTYAGALVSSDLTDAGGVEKRIASMDERDERASAMAEELGDVSHVGRTSAHEPTCVS